MSSQEFGAAAWGQGAAVSMINGAGDADNWQHVPWQTHVNARSDINGLEDWPEDKLRWDKHITVHDSSVRVALSGAGIQDADLASLTRYLDVFLMKETAQSGCEFSLSLDLSCNWGISDYGIAAYIAPFLRMWPVCNRLKLYQTSIGDRALGELSSWVADGYVHELHLSDLGRPVSGEAVLQFLWEIHRKGNYPYWNKSGGQAALWLRLEHNRIRRADAIVAKGRAEGLSLRVLSKADLATVRPGAASRGKKSPAVDLVLFRLQQSKAPLADEKLTCGQKLLMMLQENAAPLDRNAARQEPQPLSLDEFSLWQMQAREDMECGADERNKETFGEDTAAGWSFEENLAANERLATQAWTKAAFGMLDFVHLQGEVDVASATTTDALHNGGFEVDSESICSSSAYRKHHMANAARCEVEEEIYNAIALNPTLQRFDFDGRVRQHLHAIRNIGGQGKVREAMRVLHAATIDKKRSDIQKWPAYLVALLKRFIQEMPGKGCRGFM